MAKVKLKLPKIDTQLAHYEWNCDHASIVHNGAHFVNGTRLPARPWTDAAITETDTPSVYAKHYAATNDLQAAWELTAFELGDKFQEMIKDERWDWPRNTVRRNGSVVGSPRDAYDEGTLHDSQTLELS